MLDFHSREVLDICEHMNAVESLEAALGGMMYGLWVFATLGWPLANLCTSGNHMLIFIGSILIVVHVAALPFWVKAIKRFLCSTAWAKEQGFTPERIRFFKSWR